MGIPSFPKTIITHQVYIFSSYISPWHKVKLYKPFYKTLSLLTNLKAQMDSTGACFIFARQQGSLGEKYYLHFRVSDHSQSPFSAKPGSPINWLRASMADKNRAYGQQGLGSDRHGSLTTRAHNHKVIFAHPTIERCVEYTNHIHRQVEN